MGIVNDGRQGRFVEQIGTHQHHGIGAPAIEFGLQGLGGVTRAAVVQHQVRALGVQGARGVCTDAVGAAGDQHHTPAQRAAVGFCAIIHCLSSETFPPL